MITTFKLLLTLGSIFTNVVLISGLQIMADPAADGVLTYLGADPDSVTMSGHSSGGHCSCHMMIVMSDTLKGVACSKGGSFMSNYANFRNGDTAEEVSEIAINNINDLNSKGQIDPITNLKDRAVYLISGEDDKSVPAKNIDAIERIMKNFTTGHLYHNNTGKTGHNFERHFPAMMLKFIYENLGYTNEFISNMDTPVAGGWRT